MKKITAYAAALALALSAASVTAFAEDSSGSVYVTIADKDGKVAVVQEQIALSDTDGDGALTVSDALYLAHEKFYDGGAAAGFEAATGDWGLSLNKLWGTANGGSYGYYVNNKSAWSLADKVEDGDYVYAYVYTDLTAWSDSYSYFDINKADAKAGEKISVTLKRLGYDAEWNTVELAVEGAKITVDGKATSFVTDKDGRAEITIDDAGDHVVSAVSDSLVLVPPVLKVNITAESTDSSSVIVSDSSSEESSDSQTDTSSNSSKDSSSAADKTNTTTNTTNNTAGGTAAVGAQAETASNAETGSSPVGLMIAGVAALAAAAIVSGKKKND
ncbi:MAG: LPXTG cell wall anchor domain-containing protein [Ruminococcus sp.]|nr:LPXTG cell wall anchor domain-containing protein [Ruminococcus sp.]